MRNFYDHHCRMYNKRPIYWLFSSSKGSFNALIYMHRYRPDTVSVVLNDYLREFRTKLKARRDHLAYVERSAETTKGDKTKAVKEIQKINRVLNELTEYEDEVLYPLATEQVEIDLDDGVKVNYNKFGRARAGRRERWSGGAGGRPTPPQVPEEVWINQPREGQDGSPDSEGPAVSEKEPGAQAGSRESKATLDAGEHLATLERPLVPAAETSIFLPKSEQELCQSH